MFVCVGVDTGVRAFVLQWVLERMAEVVPHEKGMAVAWDNKFGQGFLKPCIANTSCCCVYPKTSKRWANQPPDVCIYYISIYLQYMYNTYNIYIHTYTYTYT